MSTMWVNSESNVKPSSVDETSSKMYVYVRRNITKVEPTDDNPDVRYTYEEAKIPKEMYPIYKEMESKLEEQDKLIASLANKAGYDVVSGGNGVYELKKDESYTSASGTYENPILYTTGMSVEATKWYYIEDDKYGKDLPYECIKSGKPSGFTDKTYFDVIV